jgi:hypothetical protein
MVVGLKTNLPSDSCFSELAMGNVSFSLSIFYLLKYVKRIRHKLNKLMKSYVIYNKLQHYLIEHACICIFLTLICVN